MSPLKHKKKRKSERIEPFATFGIGQGSLCPKKNEIKLFKYYHKQTIIIKQPGCNEQLNVLYKYYSRNGFSLIELITVLAGLALLTSIASTTLTSIFSDLENDEVQAHLNSLAAECLKTHVNMADSKEAMPAPASVDTNLLNKNNYVENSNNTCKYFQVNPKDSNSKTHLSMGFGIANGRVTKFAIKGGADTLATCKNWAGLEFDEDEPEKGGNCLTNASDYSAFFTHMDDVRKARATCNINLRANMAGTPNPTDGGNQTTWDSEADKDCKDKTLPANASSYSTANCKPGGCTKAVKIKAGKIVGYSAADYNQAQTLECSNSISSYINSGSYNGGAETKNDLDGCTGTKYICDYREHEQASYESCEIEAKISSCKKDLEDKRNTKVGNGAIDVAGTGLPPCGRKYWVCNGGIYESKVSYEGAGCT